MQFYLKLREKKYKEYFSRDEYEDSTELFLILAEFNFFYEGYIVLDFGNNNILEIEYDFEFIVEHEEFLDIVEFIDDANRKEYSIWVCEQGSDYYLNHYKKTGDNILIELKKGKDSGLKIHDFKILLSINDYKKEWIKLYRELFSFIVNALPEYKNSEEMLRYITPKDEYM